MAASESADEEASVDLNLQVQSAGPEDTCQSLGSEKNVDPLGSEDVVQPLESDDNVRSLGSEDIVQLGSEDIDQQLGSEDIDQQLGSEDIAQPLCDPCDTDGSHVAAEGFCKTCREFLCGACYIYHCKPKPMRHHVLIDAQNMPKSNSTTGENGSSTEKCLKHKELPLNIYCKVHNEFGCISCFAEDHNVCGIVSFIHDCAKGVAEGQEYREFKSDLAELQEAFKAEMSLAETNSKSIDVIWEKLNTKEATSYLYKLLEYMKILEQKKQMMSSSVTSRCEQSLMQLDKFLSDETSEVLKFMSMKRGQKIITQTRTCLQSVKTDNKQLDEMCFLDDFQQCQSLLRNVNTCLEFQTDPSNSTNPTNYQDHETQTPQDITDVEVRSNIGSNVDTEGGNMIYPRTEPSVRSNSAKSNDVLTTGIEIISSITSGINDDEKDKTRVNVNTCLELQTEPSNSSNLTKFLDRETQTTQDITDVKMGSNIGTNVDTKPSVCSSSANSGDIWTTDIEMISSVTVGIDHHEDNNTSRITGSSVLFDGRVALADFNNKAIKVLIPNENHRSLGIYTSARPFDLTEMELDKIAVTFPSERRISIFMVDEYYVYDADSDDDITTSGSCYGIDFAEDNFYVTIDKPPKVEVIDTDGDVLKTFAMDGFMQTLFTSPWYVVLDPARNRIFVTDRDRDTLTCLTNEGDVVHVYESCSMKRPYGVAVDRTGMIFVCARRVNKLVCLTADFEEIGVIEDDSLLHKAESVACWNKQDRLYIGLYEDNELTVMDMHKSF